MNKIFIALLLFCFIGAGVLWWLMNNMPRPKPFVPDSKVGEIAKEELVEKNKKAQPKTIVIDDSKKAEGPILSILSSPVEAEIFRGDQRVGKTPIKIQLEKDSFELTLRSEGFEDYSKEVASIKDSEGADLRWQIQLKPKKGALKNSPRSQSELSGPSERKVLKTENPSVLPKGFYLSGKRGPYFVQVQSFNASNPAELAKNVGELKKSLPLELRGCRVQIKNGENWVRVFSGPYEKRDDAERAQKDIVSILKNDAFVTGAQTCRQ